MKKSFFLLLSLALVCSVTVAQVDTLRSLNSNSALKNSSSRSLSSNTKMMAVTLPFFDDFAGRSSVPDPNKWESNSASFVNTGYPRAPFSIGAVTFDGLNRFGYPYNPLTTATGPADTLTSKPVDLSIANAADSNVYISFFYQPRGWGDAPETADSLVLEFYKPSQAKWTKAWSRSGYDPGILTDPVSGIPVPDSAWKYVTILIADTAYMKTDFRFRFRNKASQSGSVDHWHVDYVFLKNNRTASDSVDFKDIAFGHQAPSLLKNYSSMPWWQVSASDMASDYPIFVRNNNYTQNAELYGVPFIAYDQNNTAIPISTVGNPANVENFKISGWDSAHAIQNISSLPAPVLTDSGTYKTKLWITESANDFSIDANLNDTLYGKTHFYNYYAYDDGTAEAGYGFTCSTCYGSMMAVQFTLNYADTLRALDIYFDPVVNVTAISNSTYEIWLWNDNNGEPGSSIYIQGPHNPKFFTDSVVNTFDRDTINNPVALNPGTYYIGIKQIGNTALNVGFDRNYNHREKMFYNTTGAWANSSFPGSYMIRPVMRMLDLASGVASQNAPVKNVFVFPNPAKENITISTTAMKNGDLMNAQIFDYSGRLILSENVYNNQSIDIRNICSGIYILKISDGKKILHTTKLFVTH